MQPGMPDLRQIVLKAQQMQADMERAQATLSRAEVTGHAGGGLVTATVSGDGQLLRVGLDPSVVDPADVETLGDLIVAAVRDATRQAGELSSDAMGVVTQDLAGGFDLSALGLGGFGSPGGTVDALEDGDPGDDLEDDEGDEDDDEEDEVDDSLNLPGPAGPVGPVVVTRAEYPSTSTRPGPAGPGEV